MKLDKVVEGKHKMQAFRYRNGKLTMFGKEWDKADIQMLVEVANLLSVEGYELKTPISTKKVQMHSMFGGDYEIDQKLYNEDGE